MNGMMTLKEYVESRPWKGPLSKSPYSFPEGAGETFVVEYYSKDVETYGEQVTPYFVINRNIEDDSIVGVTLYGVKMKPRKKVVLKFE